MAKPVLQFKLDGTLVKEYATITRAANSVERNESAIRQAIKYNHTSAGYKWEYKEEEGIEIINSTIDNNAKILFIDIETSPIELYAWGIGDQTLSIDQIKTDWKILCWAAKWLDKKEIISDAIINHNKEIDDFEIVNSLWKLLNDADIVVGHNVSKFDIKKINARFLFHGMTPPSPYKMVDTLLMARQNFAITSNKLDYLSKFIGSDGKMKHEGFELWVKCLNNDRQAWSDMIKYNKKDVIELEKIYLKLRSWDIKHPSVSIYNKATEISCTKCGCTSLTYIKDVYTNVKEFKLYQCNNPECRSWNRSRVGTNKKVLMSQ